MTRSLKPPRGAEMPTAMLYDHTLPASAKITWLQLRGLAWGQMTTPPLSMDALRELTGHSQSTLYGHLTLLRTRNCLSWQTAEKGTLIVSFEPAFQDSRKLETPNVFNKLQETSISNPKLESQETSSCGFQNSGKLERTELTEFDALFSELTGLPIPRPATERERKAEAARWYQPVRRMVALANGESAAILREAVARLRQGGMTIAGPRSVVKTFTALYGERRGQSTARTYIEAE